MNNYEDAGKICYQSGGSLAVIKDNKELQEVIMLFQKKKRAAQKAKYCFVQNSTANYFPISKIATSAPNAKEMKCLILGHNSSISFDFEVLGFIKIFYIKKYYCTL